MVSFIHLHHVSSGIDAGLRLTDCTAPRVVSVPQISPQQILVPELSEKCKQGPCSRPSNSFLMDSAQQHAHRKEIQSNR